MLSAILKQNKSHLQGTGSYLLPYLDKIICKLHQFERDAGSEFDNLFTYRIFPKGTCLCTQGLHGKPLWFLKEGIARLFLVERGKEVTMCFFFSGEFIDVYYSAACPVKIELIQDSALYIINRDKLNRLVLVYPVLCEIGQLLFECHTMWLEHRIINFHLPDAKERYANLVKFHKSLILDIPTTYLASFLELSPETLCRIRSQF